MTNEISLVYSFCEAVQYQCFRNQTVQIVAVGESCVKVFKQQYGFFGEFYDDYDEPSSKKLDIPKSKDSDEIYRNDFHEQFCDLRTCGNNGICIETRRTGSKIADMKRCHCDKRHTGAYCESFIGVDRTQSTENTPLNCDEKFYMRMWLIVPTLVLCWILSMIFTYHAVKIFERKCGKSRERFKVCQSPKHACGSGQSVEVCKRDGGSRRMSMIRTSACQLGSRRPSLNPSTAIKRKQQEF